MSKPEKRKGPRRVEITGPEDGPPDAGAEDTEQGAERPFAPEDQEEAAAAEEVVEEAEPEEKDEVAEAETVEAETAELENAIAELEEKCAYAEDQRLRIAAELQNYKRRAQKEKDQLVRFATERLVTELIPVLDNFERAMQVEIDSPGAESLLAGVQMIYDQLYQVLETQGVARIEALGEAFDPSLHDAVEREATRALPPNVVVAELAKGYRMHDRVIRPSKVRVSAAPSENPSDEGEEESG